MSIEDPHVGKLQKIIYIFSILRISSYNRSIPLFKKIIYIYVLLFSASGFSSEKSMDRTEYLYTGKCIMANDPDDGNKDENLWPNACLKGNAAYQILENINMGRLETDLSYAELYLGVHLNKYISFHSKNYLARIRSFYPDELNKNDLKRTTDSMFLQIGNSALSRWRLSLGRIVLPFGLNDTPHMRIFDYTYSSAEYWKFPAFGYRLSFDNSTDLQIDYGYVHDNGKSSNIGGKEIRVQSFRILYDISPLSGSRMIFSISEDSNEERRLGFGFLNVSQEIYRASFEWIRIGRKGKYFLENSNQLIRFTFKEVSREKDYWLFEFEDRSVYGTLTTVGYEYFLLKNYLLKVNLSYFRSRTELIDHHYIAVLGGQVDI
ncbi:MAG: hypothetical protein HQK54_12015 [Oligoflexales bacterium]|nr:hypothetical protein [Oligoflexales bacterium]